MKIFITGLAGFLGSHLAHRLLENGHEVMGIDLVHPNSAWRLADIRGKLEYIWASAEDCEGLIPHCDAIVHCSAVTDVGLSSRSPRYATHVNVDHTAHLMETAYRHGKRVIIISTHSVYGRPMKPDSVMTEDTVCQPSNFYGASKYAEELLAMSYARQHGLPVTALRMTLMYGPKEREGALVSMFIKRCLNGEPIMLDGGGEQTRPLLYVTDALNAIELALGDNRTYGEVYNVASDEEVQIKTIAGKAMAFANSYGVYPLCEVTLPRAGEEGRINVSTDKIEALGFRATVDFETGFQEVAESLWHAKMMEH